VKSLGQVVGPSEKAKGKWKADNGGERSSGRGTVSTHRSTRRRTKSNKRDKLVHDKDADDSNEDEDDQAPQQRRKISMIIDLTGDVSNSTMSVNCVDQTF
jgi:hypothetical protein